MSVNIRQRFVLWLMGCCILAILLYPPWWRSGRQADRDWFFGALGAKREPPATLPADFFDMRRLGPGSVIDLGRRVKQKYTGAYDDLPDAEVGRRVKAKFPDAYDDFVDVADLLTSRTFRRLPVEEQLRQLRKLDANFNALSPEAQLRVLALSPARPVRSAGIYYPQMATEAGVVLIVGAG